MLKLKSVTRTSHGDVAVRVSVGDAAFFRIIGDGEGQVLILAEAGCDIEAADLPMELLPVLRRIVRDLEQRDVVKAPTVPLPDK